MNFSKNLILVGVITSCHGIKGHVILKCFTSPAIKIIKRDLINESEESVTITLIKPTNKGELICKFNDISTRNEAGNLKGYKLYSLRSNLPTLEEDEFYIADLKNLSVLDQDSNVVGKVKNILNFGAGDIIEVEFLDKTTELLPFKKDFFPVITNEYIVLNYVREII